MARAGSERPLTCRKAIDIVEAGYQLGADRNRWLEDLTACAAPELDRGAGVIAYIADSRTMEMRALGSSFVTPQLLGALQKLNDCAPETVKKNFGRVSRGYYAVHDEFKDHDELIDFWRREVLPLGLADGIGVHAPAGRDTLTLWAPSPRIEATPTRIKGIWTRVGAHLSSGLRLRTALGDRGEEGAEAIVGVDGKVKHAAGPAEARDARDVLREAVRAMERARGPMRRRDPEAALELWTALVHGRWSLVDYWDRDGRRFFAAHPNAPGAQDPRRLSAREISALTITVEGATPKEVAYALGISHSNVRALIASTLRKLGLRSRAELHRLPIQDGQVIEVPLSDEATVSVLEVRRERAAVAAETVLTKNELAVARLAAAGRSNAEISALRRTSSRTVANQMASILRKLNLRSRIELAAHVNQSQSESS